MSEFEVRESLTAADLPRLLELLRSAWWAADRDPAELARALAASSPVFVVAHRATGQLTGFARVLTDGVYLAVILDVVVAREWRGHGLGALLMEAVVGHPLVAGVRSVELVCQPDLIPFYRRWGFTDRVGTSHLLRRTADPLLSPATGEASATS